MKLYNYKKYEKKIVFLFRRVNLEILIIWRMLINEMKGNRNIFIEAEDKRVDDILWSFWHCRIFRWLDWWCFSCILSGWLVHPHRISNHLSWTISGLFFYPDKVHSCTQTLWILQLCGLLIFLGMARRNDRVRSFWRTCRPPHVVRTLGLFPTLRKGSGGNTPEGCWPPGTLEFLASHLVNSNGNLLLR